MKTISQFAETKQTLFSHELIKKSENSNTIFVYKNKGYAGKSKTYGIIFEVTGKDIDGIKKFKTKTQVIKFLNY